MIVALTKGQKEAKDELVGLLTLLRGNSDKEMIHAEADMALLAFIERVTGDMRITSAYLALDRWYA
jgi:hypothetical protein